MISQRRPKTLRVASYRTLMEARLQLYLNRVVYNQCQAVELSSQKKVAPRARTYGVCMGC